MKSTIGKLPLYGAIAALTLAAAAPAYAGAAKGGKFFDRIDADSNGLISTEEAAAASTERFGKMDTNGDGTITKDEIAAKHDERAKERAERRQQHADAMFQRLDTDGDGTISQAEMDAQRDALFTKLDTNGDGSVSKDEAGEFHKQMRDQYKTR